MFRTGCVIMVLLWAIPLHADTKTLSNSTLKEKGYDRLEGNSQFRLGCRYIVRSDNKAIVYRPTEVSGMAISLTIAGTYYTVLAGDKATLYGSDGSSHVVTTWRNCVIL